MLAQALLQRVEKIQKQSSVTSPPVEEEEEKKDHRLNPVQVRRPSHKSDECYLTGKYGRVHTDTNEQIVNRPDCMSMSMSSHSRLGDNQLATKQDGISSDSSGPPTLAQSIARIMHQNMLTDPGDM